MGLDYVSILVEQLELGYIGGLLVSCEGLTKIDTFILKFYPSR